MRGLPGSGKSFKAKKLAGDKGVVFSTDDFFMIGGKYQFDAKLLGDNHEKNYKRAVEAMKEGKEADLDKALLEHRTEIDLKISALIPESYLGDVQLRLLFYKKIANAKTSDELDDIQVEMIDRFGLLPEQAKNLFAVTELKLEADRLGILKIEASDLSGKIEFNEKPNIKPETIIKLIQDTSRRYQLIGATKMKFTLAKHEKKDRVDIVKEVIKELSA